jgi:hypothetical protein
MTVLRYPSFFGYIAAFIFANVFLTQSFSTFNGVITFCDAQPQHETVLTLDITDVHTGQDVPAAEPLAINAADANCHCSPTHQPTTGSARRDDNYYYDDDYSGESCSSTHRPTTGSGRRPTRRPTRSPTRVGAGSPTDSPTESPDRRSRLPTEDPTDSPTESPDRRSRLPTEDPTACPSGCGCDDDYYYYHDGPLGKPGPQPKPKPGPKSKHESKWPPAKPKAKAEPEGMKLRTSFLRQQDVAHNGRSDGGDASVRDPLDGSNAVSY